MAKDVEIKVEIKNLPQIRAAFRQSPRIMTKNLTKAIQRSTIMIHDEEILNVSGSRGIRVVTTGLKSAVQAGISFPSPLKGVLFPNIEYAIFVHENTKFRKGRPFLQNAVDTKQTEVDKEFEKAVQNTLDEIARKVG